MIAVAATTIHRVHCHCSRYGSAATLDTFVGRVARGSPITSDTTPYGIYADDPEKASHHIENYIPHTVETLFLSTKGGSHM